MCDLYNKILHLVENLESATLIDNENGSFYVKTSNDIFSYSLVHKTIPN